MKNSLKNRQGDAFTVIELMVVIAILGLLMAISMSAFGAAIAQAKISRTKVIIAKLDQLVMERYEGYRTRPIPIRPPANQDVRTSAQNRLLALREIMRMELPGSKQDVNDNPVIPGVTRTAISRGYVRRVPSGWTESWQQAECLYLIIASMRDGDKSALDFFSPEEIGDIDDDGVPEILDAWGTPIQFIRWPAGYLSDDTNYPALTMQNQTTPDSFDLLKADYRWNPTNNSTLKPYDLKPLIFSYGPDRQLAGPSVSAIQYSVTTPTKNDPYFHMGSDPLPGAITDAAAYAASADNITNHYQEAE
ncbi:type II secretion system protein [Anatilimnocola floriformis]|uniref:type II secretion system protein n=1 Tax=Anatilimnocola floriformis TaxID=2948575 RepID=UPI0020C56EED|nr:type II secretion system protein [Anatilimnocola floriformis]